MSWCVCIRIQYLNTIGHDDIGNAEMCGGLPRHNGNRTLSLISFQMTLRTREQHIRPRHCKTQFHGLGGVPLHTRLYCVRSILTRLGLSNGVDSSGSAHGEHSMHILICRPPSELHARCSEGTCLKRQHTSSVAGQSGAHLVISSPSRSTTGLSTLILGNVANCLCASPSGIARDRSCNSIAQDAVVALGLHACSHRATETISQGHLSDLHHAQC